MTDTSKFQHNAVLLIDDNELDNYVNEKVILTNQFAKTVYVNTSARGALEFIRNLNMLGKDAVAIYPTVIFIDINMPGMSGFDFIRYFEEKAEENLVRPKLVILTSSTSNEDKLLALEAGEHVQFLNKPLTEQHLQNI